MGQITIDLDPESEEKAKAYAKMMDMPLNQWIADLIRKQVAEEWPDSVKELAGAWPDFPPLEEIRAGNGDDAGRESL
jgi:hypothetical protein